MERTFVMIKPDGLERGFCGNIIYRFEQKGYRLAALKLIKIDQELAKKHYAEHEGKPFFSGLVNYITSSPVVVMVLEGKDVIATVRKMMGATDPLKAEVGTIRGDLAIDIGRNIIHGSDSKESAEREISLYFKPEEILEYSRTIEKWIYE